tara:strand:- start:547 stop:750 length:204 start_codon:yes stop_codon:yes gene_type:complete
MIKPGDLVRIKPLTIGGGLPKQRQEIAIVLEITKSNKHQGAVWITYYNLADGTERRRYIFLSRIEKL